MTTTQKGATRQRQRKLYVDMIDATNGKTLRRLLAEYEATGDHDHSAHGTRPILPGAPCGLGDDCWVRRARAVLAAIETLSANDYRKESTP